MRRAGRVGIKSLTRNRRCFSTSNSAFFSSSSNRCQANKDNNNKGKTSRTELKQKIDEANQKVLDILYKADLWLEDIAPAREVIPALNNPKDKLLLVSGPPVTWENMAGAQKGAVIGIILYEGWAKTPDEAIQLCESNQIRFEPNHNFGSCGPMAGTVSPSYPVYVVKNRAFGNIAFSRPADLSQQFGDYTDLADIIWWRDNVAPYLRQGLKKSGPINLNEMEQNALEMGDESHNRNSANTALFTMDMSIKMLEAGVDRQKVIDVLKWYHWDQWNKGSGVRACLGLVMAMAKANLDPAVGVKSSTLVTCMARNGHEFGIKIAATGDKWYTDKSPLPTGVFFGSYKQSDAGRDMGDSAITEANGWGSGVLMGALAYLKMIPNGTVEKARLVNEQNRSLMIGKNNLFKIPAQDFEGVAVGMDVRRIVNWGLVPWVNTGITHREKGHRVIGRGLSRPGMKMFTDGIAGVAKDLGVSVEEVLATEEMERPLFDNEDKYQEGKGKQWLSD